MSRLMSFREVQEKLSSSRWLRADKRMDVVDVRTWGQMARVLHPFHSVGVSAADFCRGMALIVELAGKPRGKRKYAVPREREER
jgi:hypothetical protein